MRGHIHSGSRRSAGNTSAVVNAVSGDLLTFPGIQERKYHVEIRVFSDAGSRGHQELLKVGPFTGVRQPSKHQNAF